MLTTLAHSLVLAYGRATPYHLGRHLLISRAVHLFGLRRPRETRAKRRGVWFHLHLKDFLDVAIYYVGYHDYQETRLIEANMRAGDVFLDVGANIGYYTLLAARNAAPGGEVHSFEISPDEFDKLSANVNLNHFESSIRLNRTAVADFVGEVSITPTLSAGMTRIDDSSAGGGCRRRPSTAMPKTRACVAWTG